MSIYPKEDTPFEPSGASKYIDELIKEGKAHLTPERLKGKPTGWKFYVEADEFLGYDADPKEHHTFIDLDKEITSTRGEYEIAAIGPARNVKFENKIGQAPKRKFVIVRKLFGVTRVGFIEK